MLILSVDEAYSLLQRLTYQGKSTSQTSLSMERLCKCYDGDFWYVLKGTKGKRVGVTSAKLALLAFTTPQQFLESVWPKIVASKNGLAERLLFFYQRRSEDLDLEAMAENFDSLDEFSVKSLGNVLEKIYVEHNTTPALKYTLTATAKEVFFKFSKPNEDDSQGAVASPSISSGSKKYKNTLRVALNMHVLYHRHLPWSQGHHPQHNSRYHANGIREAARSIFFNIKFAQNKLVTTCFLFSFS